jgi:hypothetical protein
MSGKVAIGIVVNAMANSIPLLETLELKLSSLAKSK